MKSNNMAFVLDDSTMPHTKAEYDELLRKYPIPKIEREYYKYKFKDFTKYIHEIRVSVYGEDFLDEDGWPIEKDTEKEKLVDKLLDEKLDKINFEEFAREYIKHRNLFEDMKTEYSLLYNSDELNKKGLPVNCDPEKEVLLWKNMHDKYGWGI